MNNQQYLHLKDAKMFLLFALLTTGFLNAQINPLTFSWDKMGCQQNEISKIGFDSSFSNADCLKVCPKSNGIYRISGEGVANIARVEWTVSGGEVGISNELSTTIDWDNSSNGSIALYIKFNDSSSVSRSICIDKTPSNLILSWDKIGCQLNKDNVSEIKFNHNFSGAACLKVCPESTVTYEISGDGAVNVESINWTIIGGIAKSPNKLLTPVTWNNETGGSIQIAVHYTNGTNVRRTICVSKIPSSLLLGWEKLEKSVCQIKYDNSPDNADVLSVYPESTVLYRISGKGFEHVTATEWIVGEGSHVYPVDKSTALITWDDVEKSDLALKIHYDSGETLERRLAILRVQPPVGNMAQNTIVFDYDTAGNQIQRRFIYLANRHKAPDTKTAGKDSMPLLKSEYDDISYYPNPVKSELYVEWTLSKGQTIKNIELYDLSGKLIKSFPGESDINHKTINFESFPAGVYDLLLVYGNGGKKSLKIVKQ